MAVEIQKLDHEAEDVRQRIINFLAPHETHALFILGNLTAHFPGSHLYVAQGNGGWLGIVGYYSGPKSVIPFALQPEVIKPLMRHVVEQHPEISCLLGMDYVARPSYEELLRAGYLCKNDFDQVFMELHQSPPEQPHEHFVRLMEKRNLPDVARLLRLLRGETDFDKPVMQAEIDKAATNPMRYVAIADGKPVATAATNGLGITAFQILGVATHPAYRRQGYARAVCASLTRQMMRDGARSAALFTNRTNLAAQRCYEGLGFRVTGGYYVAEMKYPTT